ncbi:MAG TPA: 4a-hydroxytetrahydrobiopterin dehydratase [Microlunatus sp.]|jgi:4a-hydroxytetrahydrobiopterin dehydratase|nr:4a-hydroxytetrahydrobiopterin dehydratase [Microlunatus sp.]
MTLLTESEITAWLSTLPGWTLSEDKTSISTSIELVDFVAALDLVNEIGRLAEQRNHHPDIDIRWNTVTLVQSSHSEGGLTRADLEMAQRIDDIAGIDHSDAADSDTDDDSDDDSDEG